MNGYKQKPLYETWTPVPQKREEEKTGKRRVKEKGIEEHRTKPPTLTQSTDALVGEKEQKKEIKKKIGSRNPKALYHRGRGEELNVRQDPNSPQVRKQGPAVKLR